MVPYLIEYNSQKSNILKGINQIVANDPYVSQKYFDRFSGNKFKWKNNGSQNLELQW